MVESVLQPDGKAKIGKAFIKLIQKHFPKSHKYQEIINLSALKLLFHHLHEKYN